MKALEAKDGGGEVLEELFEEQVEVPADPRDELEVRKLMIRVAQLGREGDRLADLRTKVAAEYDERLKAIAEQEKALRESIRNYLTQVAEDGKVSFPDVGTAFLRNVAPKLSVTDKAAFEKWARAEYGDAVTKWVFDLTAAKERALTEGQVADGAEIEPAHKDLTIRGTGG